MDPFEKLLSIVHDVKSPLLAIRRLSERLLENSDSLSEKERRRLELIHASAEEASTSLEEFNLSSTLNAEASDDHAPEPVDVAQLAEEIVGSFRAHAECKSQTLRVDADDRADCTVLGDPLQLREAMNNLVSNALKFSPSGSTIEVQVRRSQDTVRFSVTDPGPGLSEREQDRLFEPLCNVGPDPTDGEDSTGVGLYIARRIVEEHEGTVEVESEKGTGSTFRFTLPAASSPASPASPVERPGAEWSSLSSTPALP
jgi:signal transduction histidine kinase